MDLLRLSRSWSARIAGFIVGLAAIVAAPQISVAQVGSTDTFLRSSFASVEEGGRTAARSRSARRNVTSTTVLEDFDVPRTATRRAARSSAKSSGATTTSYNTYTPSRPVVRKAASQRRVRVASLSSNTTTFIDVTPTTRTTVQRRARAKASRTRVGIGSMSAPLPSLTGGGIAWRANASCLAGNLRSIMSVVASRFGAVTVNSTCRSYAHNRRVGGARKSWHLTGQAVDFRVRTASIASLSAYLRGVAGGFKHYGGGRYHIDNGPKRSF